ncbi:CIC11C00000000222 [Sungouiella intermedia]|uniref:CIC11C00000000222 n=1 Tax=Sungouiella intermedia TaxID=45354 RepID=A0A1L0DN45_9ASCO|nr:CIC11C00000000222 [[Candida] intermedia]
MSSHLVRDLRLITICNFNVDVAADRILSDASPSLATDGPINVFYTLHNIKNILLYVSEVAVAYSGVDFGAASLPDLGRRLYKVKICIWIKALDQETWTLFHKLKVDVRNLIEVGNLADRDRESLFVTNTLLWRFNDIYYCLRTDLKDSSAMEKTRQLSWNRARGTKPSYTVNDIRQLTSLYIGIREFAEVKKTLGAQIAELSQMINKTPDSDIPERIRSLKFDLHTLHKYIVRQNSAIDALLSEVYLKKLHIGRSTHIIEKDFPHFKEMCSERLEIAAAQIEPLQESLNLSVYPNLISTLQEVGMVLIDTYPIELMASGRFSICGIEFPMSIREILDFCYYGHSESRLENGGTSEHDQSRVNSTETGDSPSITVETINAGLSYIVLLMMSLADLMNVSLKYPMKFGPLGSYLVDNVSPQQLSPIDQKHAMDISKSVKIKFPLFYNGDHTQKFASYENPNRNFTLKNARFEQGLNLLNKNLVFLISLITDLYSQYYHDNVANHLISNNIPVDCLDNFLWNLQYLMLFITAPTAG